MKNAPYEKTEFHTNGKYVGELRAVFNILEQWDGHKWRRVPDVVDRRPRQGGRIIFDVEDALRDDDDAADRAFRPR